MTASVLPLRPGRCVPCQGTGYIALDSWGRVLYGLSEDAKPCVRCAGTGLSSGPKLARARHALRVIFGGLSVALVCWTGSAHAAPVEARGFVDICHELADARYRETMVQSDDDHAADLAYSDAYDDCAALENSSLFPPELWEQHESYGQVRLPDGGWRPTTRAEDWSADLDNAAYTVESELITDPWAID